MGVKKVRIYKSREDDVPNDFEYSKVYFIKWSRKVADECIENLRNALNSMDD